MCALELTEYHRLRRLEESSWRREALEEQAGRAFTDAIGQLLPREKHKWAPDQFARFERSPLFEDCVQICELYRSGTDVQRDWLRSRVDRTISGNLGVFALRAAVLAARGKSPALARTSLIADAIADLAGRDIRDVLIGVSLLCHCGALSGADMPALFREVAALAGPALGAVYRDWANRYPRVQGISSMGWREIETDEGIGFRHG
jgi:hypothetical protein